MPKKKYNITMKEESELSYVFSVIPKEATAFEKLEITMDKKELWITNFVVESTETGRVSLSFSNIQRNGVTDTGLFSFVPPEGAEVIRP